MDIESVFRYLYAIAVVGVVLFAVWFLMRMLGRKQLVGGLNRRLVTVVETTYLSQNTMMHVVRIGTRYFAIGGGSAGLTMISELDQAPMEAFVENQRRVLTEQTASLGAIFNRLKR